MHLLAEKEILGKLKAGGLLKGSVEEMVDYRIGALFMPHGTLQTSLFAARGKGAAFPSVKLLPHQTSMPAR